MEVFVGRDDELAGLQSSTLEAALLRSSTRPALAAKSGSRERSTSGAARLDRVGVQPAPQGRDGDVVEQPGGDQLLAQVSQAPAAGRNASVVGLAGDRLGLGHHGGRRARRSPSPSRPSALNRQRQRAPCSGSRPGDLHVGLPIGGAQHDLCPAARGGAARWGGGPALERAAFRLTWYGLCTPPGPPCIRPVGRRTTWKLSGKIRRWPSSPSRPSSLRQRLLAGASAGPSWPTCTCAPGRVRLPRRRAKRRVLPCFGCATTDRRACGGRGYLASKDEQAVRCPAACPSATPESPIPPPGCPSTTPSALAIARLTASPHPKPTPYELPERTTNAVRTGVSQVTRRASGAKGCVLGGLVQRCRLTE